MAKCAGVILSEEYKRDISDDELSCFAILFALAMVIIWVNTQRYRILISSDDAVLISGKEVKYSKIVRAYPRLVFLCVNIKTKQMNIYIPLTFQEITQTIYDSAKK